ncbi:MAG TPA: hypothetical protein VFV98_06255 [Vicinamibacterales bacterium]|nr:hypothetical protein [Vicinamibacterales bacterium]
MKCSIALLLACALPVSAAAQTAATKTTIGWEIEGVGGVSIARLPSTGDAALPPPGATITTTSVLFPSRAVPSWFFGDGAELLNGVNARFGVAPIVPLDPALGAVGLNASTGPTFGVRLRRGLTPQWTLEAALDVMRGSADITDELLAAAETTRASFETAFAGLLGSSPLLVNPQISATMTSPSGASRDIAITGALVRGFGTGAFQPYVTLGGGLLTSAGDATLTLTGRYQFSIAGEVPIDESDTLTVRAMQRRTLVALVGGGVRHDLSARLGLRIDARALIGGQGSQLVVDATPGIATGTPADFIESFTNPAIQFSNNASTGRRSSLGEPNLDGFAVFSGTGIQVRTIITGGIYFKF